MGERGIWRRSRRRNRRGLHGRDLKQRKENEAWSTKTKLVSNRKCADSREDVQSIWIDDFLSNWSGFSSYFDFTFKSAGYPIFSFLVFTFLGLLIFDVHC